MEPDLAASVARPTRARDHGANHKRQRGYGRETNVRPCPPRAAHDERRRRRHELKRARFARTAQPEISERDKGVRSATGYAGTHMRRLGVSTLAILCVSGSFVLWGGCSRQRAAPAQVTSAEPSSASPRSEDTPCERLRRLQKAGRAACEAKAYPAAEARRRETQYESDRPWEPICGDSDPPCVEMGGAWGVVRDETAVSILHAPGDFARWHLAHVPTGDAEVRLSTGQWSHGWPHVELADGGAVSIVTRHCTARAAARSCDPYVVQTCVGATSGGSPLDCPLSHELRRPAWLPEGLESKGNAPASWTSGPLAIVVDPVARTKWIELDVPPLVTQDAGFEFYLAGPRLRGVFDASGAAVFDAPEALAWSRAACAKLATPSRAQPYDVWRSAVCARLTGKTIEWIRDQWSIACRENARRENEGMDRTLESACRVDPDEATRGMLRAAVRYLEQVTHW